MTTTQETITPTVRRTLRKWVFWISMLGVALLIVLILTLLTRGAGVGGAPLAPDNAAPQGAMALAEVLRSQGVAVTHARSLVEAREALGGGAEASLFVVDNLGVLTGQQLASLDHRTTAMIVMTPTFNQLDGFVDEVSPGGQVDGLLTPDCDLPAARAAGNITGDGFGYRLIGELPGATACYDSGQDVASLIQFQRENTTITVIGTERAFSNEGIGVAGNAALALWLLGTSDELVWYEANITDAAIPGAPTIGELTPAWVSAAIVLLGFAIVALAVWKGRRFGPLVIENLPVTVRASETTEGRARLYQKSSARLHALDTLRVGAIARLAALSGLGRSATVDDVIYRVVANTGFDEHYVRGVLVDSTPHGDADLMRLSDSLLQLERATEKATTHPSAQGE
ncbi:MAG TPA: DUF4350 domain-containing protein [Terrimesophilobacter sp.]|nr:DUF4350 domain-containing protein [Terrimesophilobacter sp.]